MSYSFDFIDLFAGIGGMRLAAERSGGRCVMSSEIDAEARRTYSANFGSLPAGDIRAIDENSVPDHKLLMAGFPCQPFSICGFKKGFEDIRGTLFFEVSRIIRAKRPEAVILENVKNIVGHDGGRTLARILEILRSELGYHADWRVVSATTFGLPQARDRCIIVATRERPFVFPAWKSRPGVKVADVLGPVPDEDYLDPEDYVLLPESQVKRNSKSGLIFCGYRKRNLRLVGVRPNTEHLSRVHKQPNRIYRSDGTHPTLAAGETSGRYWVLHEGRVRKIGIDACFRLQGFTDSFVRPCKEAQTYKQIGNSVPVPMIEAVIREVTDQCLIPADASAGRIAA